jgi:hypothetical protein
MMAIQEGKLEEVKQLIAAGGDPNDFVPESGKGHFPMPCGGLAIARMHPSWTTYSGSNFPRKR